MNAHYPGLIPFVTPAVSRPVKRRTRRSERLAVEDVIVKQEPNTTQQTHTGRDQQDRIEDDDDDDDGDANGVDDDDGPRTRLTRRTRRSTRSRESDAQSAIGASPVTISLIDIDPHVYSSFQMEGLIGRLTQLANMKYQLPTSVIEWMINRILDPPTAVDMETSKQIYACQNGGKHTR